MIIMDIFIKIDIHVKYEIFCLRTSTKIGQKGERRNSLSSNLKPGLGTLIHLA
jgi:hypothetical protein